MVRFRFQDLEIWQMAIEIANELFDIADNIEQKRFYRFAEQLRASGMSMSNNIAEGSGATSKKEFVRFLNISRRSTIENANILIISREFNYNRVDYDFLETMGIELLEGRDFSRSYGTDAQEAIIVNEALVREFGWQDPLNSKLPGEFSNELKVIGVVKDFNYGSLHSEIQPLVLALNYSTVGSGISRLSSENWPPVLQYALVRIGPGETGTIVDFLRQSWHNVLPDAPFTITFLDEAIDAQYAQEKRWGSVLNYASAIAIIVACLGLFGLSTATVEKRVKEIGIRKVLGASVIGIFSLISRKLLVLVALSNILAWPLAWLAMNKWLEDFAYRIEISWWMFAQAGSSAILIALVTVSVQAIRAALANPVDALRYE